MDFSVLPTASPHTCCTLFTTPTLHLDIALTIRHFAGSHLAPGISLLTPNLIINLNNNRLENECLSLLSDRAFELNSSHTYIFFFLNVKTQPFHQPISQCATTVEKCIPFSLMRCCRFTPLSLHEIPLSGMHTSPPTVTG